jgi:hypothetical protein
MLSDLQILVLLAQAYDGRVEYYSSSVREVNVGTPILCKG